MKASELFDILGKTKFMTTAKNIEKINLEGYISQSSTGKGYLNNNSSMTIEVY